MNTATIAALTILGIIIALGSMIAVIVKLAQKGVENKYDKLKGDEKRRERINEIRASNPSRADAIAILKRLRDNHSKVRDPSVPSDSD